MSYHQDYSALSKTAFSMFFDDPYKYYLHYVKQSHDFSKKQTPAMGVGIVGHAVLLEGKGLLDVAALYPDSCFKKNGDLNPAPSEAFRIENAGKVCMKRDDLARAVEVIDAVRKSPLGAAIEESQEKEQEHRAEVEGVLCKCRPDFATILHDCNLIYDLKFTLDPGKQAFRRVAKQFRYWLQDAHYSAVLSAENGLPSKFRFWCVEAFPPYRIKCYWFEGMTRQGAGDTHRRKLNELSDCLLSGEWEAPQDNEVVLSPYEMDWKDEEVEFKG